MTRTQPIDVVRATVLEWPQIEQLRAEYFALMGGDVQRRSPEARWYVARRGERVVGCYSVQDAPQLGQRWALDFYRVAGREGTRGVAAMYRHLYAEADADELDVLFHVHPDNAPQLRAVQRAGEAHPVGVLFLRPKRSAACRQP